MLVAARTIAIWTIVAIVDNTAAATAAARTSVVFAARAAIAPIVAVLEMKPDARPAIGRPNTGPKHADRNVARGADGHDENHQDPDRVGI